MEMKIRPSVSDAVKEEVKDWVLMRGADPREAAIKVQYAQKQVIMNLHEAPNQMHVVWFMHFLNAWAKENCEF